VHFYLAHLVRTSRSLIVSAGLLALIISTGCGSSNWSASQRQTPLSVADVAARAATGASTPPPVLLFVGTGTSSGDVAAVKTILGNLKLSYATATSSQLNAMSESALKAYKLFLMPGGNAITISNSLTRTATTNLHNAIVNDGLHYLGICAGGFFAGGSGYNFLKLMSNVFDFYEDEYDGIHKEAVEVTGSNGTKLDQYWENGPQLSGWGQIVGKYPDGTTAIAQGKSGKGWVILSGVHAEAPQGWRYGMTFTTSAAVDNAYAKTLVTAALNGTSLPHF
jgi:Biotin-protein ligase, N terminal